MPTILIPENAVVETDEPGDRKKEVVGPNGNKVFDPPYSFVKNFLFMGLLRDPEWGKDAESIFVCNEIKTKLTPTVITGRSKKAGVTLLGPGDKFELSQDQYNRLLAIARKPTGGYRVPLMSQCPTYIDAILNPHKK